RAAAAVAGDGQGPPGARPAAAARGAGTLLPGPDLPDRGGAMSHPEPEILAAYHAGELTADEERRLQDHLLSCRECSDLLLDLAGLADPGFGAGSLSAADQEALWGRIQGEIHEETQ